MWKHSALALVILPALTLSAAAASDPRQILAEHRSLSAAQQVLIGQMRANLAEKKELQAEYKKLDIAAADYDRQVVEASAYCQGRYEEQEYRRRLAVCEAKQGELDAAIAVIADQRKILDEGDAARQRAALRIKADHDAVEQAIKEIEARMAADANLAGLVEQCGSLKSAGDRSTCFGKNWVPPKPDKATALLDALQNGRGDWQKSIADLEAQLSADPDNVGIRDALSYLKGLYEGHLRLSKLGNLRYKQGVLAWMTGDYEQAAIHFGESYEIDPDDQGALSAYGFVSGLSQSRINLSALAPCHLLPDCDPLTYAGEFSVKTQMPAGYRLLPPEQQGQLQALRITVLREPENLRRRAALAFMEGMVAWDDYRDRAKADAQKVSNVPRLAEGLTQMGRGQIDEALATFIGGLDSDWDDDGFIFAFYHAMGLNEGMRGLPKFTPDMWDERTAAVLAELYDAEFMDLYRNASSKGPPWAGAKEALRREQMAAWSRFLSEPLAAR